ncbi:hypothetical protein DPV78_007804 [Talaromyces pinophilus]|nr:hypothetical protein DPV78_007804 [Talaromyces pinophilus]
MSSSERWAPGPALSLLPVELVAAIVALLPLKDIVSLAKTSRLMHQRMIPFMYPVLEIIQQVPWVPNAPGFDLEKYQRTFFQEDGLKETLSIFSIVKDLRVLPQPWSFQRCLLAMHLARTGDPRREHEDGMQHTRILEAFSLMASQMFSNVQPGKLGHFAWMLGYCMPPEVLGPEGYITINQSNLKSLALAVDGACTGYGLAGLSQLDNLRHFSWRGVVTKQNFRLFRTVIERNAHHLVSLEVEVLHRAGRARSINEVYLDLIWLGLLVPSHRHIERLERARSVKNEFRLNKLVSLSLRNVSLVAWKTDTVLTFDPARLTSLTLDYCVKTLRFFETWDQCNHGLSLRSFRGMIDEPWAQRTSFPLEDLLRKHGSRLEDFYLSIGDISELNMDFGLYAPCLKRMILSFYRRPLVTRTESTLLDTFSIAMILEDLPGLEGFAFSRAPQLLRSFLRHHAGPFPSLKVIHFRTPKGSMSGISPMVDYSCSTKTIIDSINQYERYQPSNSAASFLSGLVEFANWAFDCTCFPNLDIVAMGDVSMANGGVVLRRKDHLPRYSLGHVEPLLQAYNDYRNIDSSLTIPFEFVKPHDLRPWEGLEKCREMVLANSLHEPWAGNIFG